MSADPSHRHGTPSRGRLEAIPRRVKVGPVTALLLALAFALLVTPIIRGDLWLASSGGLDVRAGEAAPVTVRVPAFAGHGDPVVDGAIVIARGDVADARTAALVAQVRARSPHGVFGDLAYFAVVLALAALYTLQLRRSSNRGRFLRTQVVLLGVLVVTAAIIKLLLLTTAMSVLAVPVALLALATAMALDREAGVATGLLASVVVGLLVPFDIGVTAILLVQALTASLLLPDRIRRRWRVALGAGLGAALTGAIAYGLVHYLTVGTAPLDELGRFTASSWLAAGAGGVIAAFLSVPAVPPIQVACGEITDGALIQLEDLSHPLLKQIAERSPGTWQHSLAMANMAEIAANAIGANGRLVRVGAYFHDLGKSLQPKYFIENVESGEQSPHDRLAPEVSCDAIFAHVTEGIAAARKHRLPERIIDFMHMHHGDGVLEYFWAKCNEQGNPSRLTVEDFRYPGVPPQTRETAILAICDAVEAASRTLRRPDQKAIDNLVQRIVYGKLHLGQLDESGLSMADLRKINDSLRETIKHAHHGRIEYPWQRDERAAEEREAQTVAERPPSAVDRSITQRIMDEPRLDSLDAPRPPWAQAGGTGGSNRSRRAATPEIAAAPTERVSTGPGSHGTGPTVALRRDPGDVAHAATAQQAAAEPSTTTSRDLAAALYPDALVAHVATAVMTAPERGTESAPIELRAEDRVLPPPAPKPVAVTVPETATGTAAETETGAAAETAAVTAAEAGAEAEPATATAAEPESDVETVERAASRSAPRWSQTFAAAAEDALSDVSSTPGSTTIHPRRKPVATPWGLRLADRIDAMVEGGEDDYAIPEAPGDGVPGEANTGPTVRRSPPPPPRRHRTTNEVDGDDVEASIEVAPKARGGEGAIVGPPPATRAVAARPIAPHDEDAPEDDGDDDVTVVPARPRSSMLPPRARTQGKPRE